MITFEIIQDVPVDFDGHCYVKHSHAQYWFKDGILHNETGPAIVWDTKSKGWYQQGLRHRAFGPAYECCTGKKKYFFFGRELSLEEYKLDSILVLM